MQSFKSPYHPFHNRSCLCEIGAVHHSPEHRSIIDPNWKICPCTLAARTEICPAITAAFVYLTQFEVYVQELNRTYSDLPNTKNIELNRNSECKLPIVSKRPCARAQALHLGHGKCSQGLITRVSWQGADLIGYV